MNEKTSWLKNRSDSLIYRALPNLLLEIMRKYFRLQITGIENIPKKGPVLVTPNHSGFSGFDAFMLAHEIKKATGRIPRTLTHHLWFFFKATSVPAQKVGFIEASMPNGLAQLSKQNLVILFPEGEFGNFKPSAKRYRLQPFKSGFVRMALLKQCPIVPTLILGAEETHISLTQLRFTKFLRGLILPLPLNLIPLPAKWKIVFLPPIYLPYKPEAAEDVDLVREIASDIREQMQEAIRVELSHRNSIFF